MKYMDLRDTILMILTFACSFVCNAQGDTNILMQESETVFERDNKTTATYGEAITYYEELSMHKHVQMLAIGSTDSGYPLHEVVVTNDGVFDPQEISKAGKVVMLVNNAIHPGEPCGVDASMMLARDLLANRANLLEHAVVVIIPVYNIGGALNRGKYSRANQNGPEAYGFRGNAKNLDLNRDFIKSDSKNARAFAMIYHKWKPQIFIDNHTSNGADYQYTMTLIPTQKDKLHPTLASHMSDRLLPSLYQKMEEKNYEMTPYVYAMHEIPDKGIMGFLDLSRYSSGYASLHHAISFMPETHMLKEYKDRVRSTYAFMESMLEYISKEYSELLHNFKLAREQSSYQNTWPLQYELDKEDVGQLTFKGFEAKYKTSGVTGMDRLYYDRSAPYTKSIPYYNTYKAAIQVDKPMAYVIPQAYSEIIELMELNGVEVQRLAADTVIELDMYYIEDYSSTSKPYEGHYLHHSVEVKTERQSVQFYKGDYKIVTDQVANRYIVETLEPQGPDSFFAWNFFDGTLMQKEHFSAYVWEDLAADILAADKELKAAYAAKLEIDEQFRTNALAQLHFIYQHSNYHEPTYLRYPVGRLTVK